MTGGFQQLSKKLVSFKSYPNVFVSLLICYSEQIFER